MAFLLSAVIFLAPTVSQARVYAAIVVDAQTGTVLFERSANRRLYPASLTKIMTLYMVFDALETGRLKLNQRLPVSRRAAGQPPSKIGLRRGKTISVENAILAIVTKSANDAATVLSEALGGTEAGFARQMTARARKLGLQRTSFRNATGLPNRRQRTTAKDMAILAVVMQRDFPQYYDYFSKKRFAWKGRTFRNHNNLLNGYSGTDGIKTGYIRASGFNLVASVKRNGVRLIGVVFGGRTARSRDRNMIDILNRGFAERDRRVASASNNRLAIVLPAVANPGPAILRQVTPMPIDTVMPALKPQLAALARKPGKPKKTINIRTATYPTGNWGIQVGTFRRPASAQRRIHQVAALAPNLLMQKGVAIVPVAQGSRTLYRAQLNGLGRRDAYAACRVLRKRSLACTVLPPHLAQMAMN